LNLHQTQLNSPVHLREDIREVVGIKDRAALDITAVLDNLRQVEPTSNSTIYWTTGISTFVLHITVIGCYYHGSFMIRNWRCILRRAVRQGLFPRPRQRTKIDTRHSSEPISTLDIVL
jgi:hypothetical protein